MLNFRVYGTNPAAVMLVTRCVGRALFLCDMDVKDYSECSQTHVTGIVRAEKGVVDSIDPADTNAFVFIGHDMQIKDLNNGSIVLLYSKDKIGSQQLKKHKTKNYIIEYQAMPEEQKAAATVLGGITKIFDKISAKNMRIAIEMEMGKDKAIFDSFDEGYKNVKLLR
jgi:hypothetical protein